MTTDNDERPDELQLFKVADRRYAAFTTAGDFLAVMDYDQARPLLFKPEARRQFLAEHGDQASDQPSGA
jgi:hypothetical protein